MEEQRVKTGTQIKREQYIERKREPVWRAGHKSSRWIDGQKDRTFNGLFVCLLAYPVVLNGFHTFTYKVSGDADENTGFQKPYRALLKLSFYTFDLPSSSNHLKCVFFACEPCVLLHL